MFADHVVLCGGNGVGMTEYIILEESTGNNNNLIII